MSKHEKDLAEAFDGQASLFEHSPVHRDEAALARLAAFAALPPDSLVLDVGCGPGFLSEAFLKAGHRIFGIDLSAEMIARAKTRCALYGERAVFEQTSVFDPLALWPFDAVASRYVVHHVVDPEAFLKRQVALVKPGGVIVVCDHVTDTDPARAAIHHAIEVGRDKTHTKNFTSGGLLDLFASVGLSDLKLVEESFILDFDEWFNRGTPQESKDEARARMVDAPQVRGWGHSLSDTGSIKIDGIRALVRGIRSV